MAKSTAPPEPPAILRPCGACTVVDDGPRVQHDVGDGRVMYFHDPADPACEAEHADPHPEIDEDPIHSQQRVALAAAGLEVPDRPLNIESVDCSDPANHNDTQES